MSTPASLDEFNSTFLSWPDDALSRRIDRIPAGSAWDIRELGTFQILRTPPAKINPPIWLQSHFAEAIARVRESVPMQSVLQLFRQDWRNMTHEDLTRAAGPLASFVTLLSQVLETAIVSDPLRELRVQGFDENAPTVLPSTGVSSSPPMSSSPPEFPNKRFRKDRSSSSYWPSDESDQSSHDQRAKSEATTNACIYELLRCVTEISRKTNDSPFRLEWTITQDTARVHAGSHEYTTINDGNFVHKAHRMGYWQRASNYSYCSIEVKSWHNTLEKPRTVKAQEAAHLVAMFSQHISAEVALQHDLVVPLVSGAQNLFSLVLGNFPREYEQYLHDGSQSEQLAFAKVEEYGMFKMQDSDELKIVFTIIVALNLKLQSLGPPLNLKVQALALMQETYKDAEHVLVFDSALENTDHTSLDYLEILARVLTSDWMRRLWTLQEAFLAQNLWVQFSREAISIDQLLIEHNEMDKRVEARIMYTFTRNFVFSIRRRRALKPSSHTFHIHTLALGIIGRSVTEPCDEPLCLSTILDLDMGNATAVARAPPEQRMKILWDRWSKSTHGIPGKIIFSDGPKLSHAGYRWAPSTLLRGSMPSVLLPEGFGTGMLCPSGLKVHFPGILLSSTLLSREASGKMKIDRPNFLRDGKGLWYTFTVGDLDATNARVADNPGNFIQELAAAKSPFPPNVKIDYCRYAVIMSGQDGNIIGSTNALLVHLHGKEGQIFLTRCIQSILPPSIVHHSLGPILEAAFQFVQDVRDKKTVDLSADETTEHSSAHKTAAAAAQGSVQKDGPFGMGEEALAKDPALEPVVRKFSANPAASMQRWIEYILDGNFVALGQILPETQEWCVD